MALITLFFHAIFGSYFVLAAIFAALTGIVFNIVIDIRGIEVNTVKHEVREYRSFLWYKWGMWRNLNDFRSIHLLRNKVVARNLKFSSRSFEVVNFYNIRLVDEMHQNEIFLAEYRNYYKARHIARSVAEVTGLEYREFIGGNPERKRHGLRG